MSAILVLRDLVVAVPSRRAPIQVSLAPDPDQDKPAVLTAVDADEAAATALARTVAGLVKPVSGQVIVGGTDVTGKSPGARQIGYVPASGALLPHLTVRQNIEYLIWRQEAVRGLVRNWADKLIDHLELGPVVGLRPHGIPETGTMRELAEIRAKSSGMTWEQLTGYFASTAHTRRVMTLEEVANVAAFMASDRASGMTGTSVNLSMGALAD